MLLLWAVVLFTHLTQSILGDNQCAGHWVGTPHPGGVKTEERSPSLPETREGGLSPPS